MHTITHFWWSDPGYCSVVVTAKLDYVCLSNNVPGTSTNVITTDFIVARMDTFTLTDASDGSNSKQDPSDADATPTDNVLFVGEDIDGQAQVAISLAWTPTNAAAGNVGYLFKWQIDGGGWSPASGDFSVGTVTSVWTDPGGPVDREFTVTVLCDCGPNGNCEYCVCKRMLKITVIKVETDHDLWWFNGENPGGEYNITAMLTAQGATTGTFKWDVTSGGGVIDLNNGGADADSITAMDDNNVAVKSTGASSSMGDVTIALTYNGTVVCNYNLTVRKPGPPQLINGFPTDAAWGPGFKTTYAFKVLDQFGAEVPFDMPVNESFGDWTSDWFLELWPEPTPNGKNTATHFGVDHAFIDEYGLILGFPLPVNPSDPNAGDAVQHATQYYRAGSMTPGAGILIKQHTLQHYRGKARQQ